MTDPTTEIAGAAGAPNIAVDVMPDNEPGTFLLDVSEVDGLELLGWGEDGWVNVVCDVTRVRVARGATRQQGALTRTEAGSCTVELLDVDRRFDPMVNADAVHPGSQVRVRAWDEDDDGPWQAVLFTGTIAGDGFGVDYQRTGPPVVQFTASDRIGTLARFEAVGRADPGVGAGDDLLERVHRVVAEVGLSPATVATDSDAGYVATLAPSALAQGWDDITAATDAELGRVWVNAANELVVRARGSELTGPVRATLSDWHGETIGDLEPHVCYVDPVVRFGTEQLVNRAIGARRVPSPADGSTPAQPAVVQVDDTYSQARWSDGGAVAHTNRQLEVATDVQVRPWAEHLVLAASTPELRVDSVTPAPYGAGSPAAWRAVCETDVGDRAYFRLHPELGDSVRRTLGVLGLSHEITPEAWETVWHTVTAPTPGVENPTGWFVLGLSELNGEDVLAPIGGPVA